MTKQLTMEDLMKMGPRLTPPILLPRLEEEAQKIMWVKGWTREQALQAMLSEENRHLRTSTEVIGHLEERIAIILERNAALEARLIPWYKRILME